jgi:hypothetical protein
VRIFANEIRKAHCVFVECTIVEIEYALTACWKKAHCMKCFYGWVGPILPEKGVNSDLLVIFCACSMQNIPGDSVMLQMDFRTK